MTGPHLYVVAKQHWQTHLERERVSAWYHEPRRGLAILAPGAYARQDHEGGASAGDAITLRSDLYEAAKQAAAAFTAELRPTHGNGVAFGVVAHEFAHCMVRLDTEGRPLPGDIERFSHPTEPVPAIQHAIRHGFPLNAFTRLLRWRHAPHEAWTGARDWLLEAEPEAA
jgi:hypothetical protein